MACGVDAHVGTDEAVVSDGYLRLVEHGEIEVGKESLAHPYVFAEVAMERLVDKRVLVGLSQNLPDHLVALSVMGGSYLVILPAAVVAGVQFFHEVGVGRVVNHPGLLFFVFSHSFRALVVLLAPSSDRYNLPLIVRMPPFGCKGICFAAKKLAPLAFC